MKYGPVPDGIQCRTCLYNPVIAAIEHRPVRSAIISAAYKLPCKDYVKNLDYNYDPKGFRRKITVWTVKKK